MRPASFARPSPSKTHSHRRIDSSIQKLHTAKLQARPLGERTPVETLEPQSLLAQNSSFNTNSFSSLGEIDYFGSLRNLGLYSRQIFCSIISRQKF
jgi:hypothetical protein